MFIYCFFVCASSGTLLCRAWRVVVDVFDASRLSGQVPVKACQTQLVGAKVNEPVLMYFVFP